MRVVLNNIVEELDRIIEQIPKNSRSIKYIVLDGQEWEELKKEHERIPDAQCDPVRGQYGTYCGVPLVTVQKYYSDIRED